MKLDPIPNRRMGFFCRRCLKGLAAKSNRISTEKEGRFTYGKGGQFMIRFRDVRWFMLGGAVFAFVYMIVGGHDRGQGWLIFVVCGLATILSWNWGKRKY
jgi:hypothetical protein